jgi:hypothetical protein
MHMKRDMHAKAGKDDNNFVCADMGTSTPTRKLAGWLRHKDSGCKP